MTVKLCNKGLPFNPILAIIKEYQRENPITVQTVKHSFYRIEIDFPETPQHPIVYFRKECKCKTAKGMYRQMNRVTNESCDAWREYNFRRLTVSRVSASEVTTN